MPPEKRRLTGARLAVGRVADVFRLAHFTFRALGAFRRAKAVARLRIALRHLMIVGDVGVNRRRRRQRDAIIAGATSASSVVSCIAVKAGCTPLAMLADRPIATIGASKRRRRWRLRRVVGANERLRGRDAPAVAVALARRPPNVKPAFAARRNTFACVERAVDRRAYTPADARA